MHESSYKEVDLHLCEEKEMEMEYLTMFDGWDIIDVFKGKNKAD